MASAEDMTCYPIPVGHEMNEWGLPCSNSDCPRPGNLAWYSKEWLGKRTFDKTGHIFCNANKCKKLFAQLGKESSTAPTLRSPPVVQALALPEVQQATEQQDVATQTDQKVQPGYNDIYKTRLPLTCEIEEIHGFALGSAEDGEDLFKVFYQNGCCEDVWLLASAVYSSPRGAELLRGLKTAMQRRIEAGLSFQHGAASSAGSQ